MLRTTAIIASCIALTACATVTRGTSTTFVVNTDPVGAKVELSTGQSCAATPCSFPHVSRQSEFSVTISKPGYKTVTQSVTHHMAGGGTTAMLGNVLIGGVIGAVVDSNNGSTQDLVPNPMMVALESDAAVASAAPAATPVATAVPADASALAAATPAVASAPAGATTPAVQATPAAATAPGAPAGH